MLARSTSTHWSRLVPRQPLQLAMVQLLRRRMQLLQLPLHGGSQQQLLLGPLVAAGIHCMADVKSYDSSTQLRAELERSGVDQIPMHLINRLMGKKGAAPAVRAAARPAATPSNLIDIDLILGATVDPSL